MTNKYAMAIVYINNYLAPEYKGPVFNLLLELSKHREVISISSMKKHGQYFNGRHERETDVINPNFLIIRYDYYMDYRGILVPKNLEKILEHLGNETEILVCDEHFTFTTSIAYKFAKKNNLPIIVNVRRNQTGGSIEKLFLKYEAWKEVALGCDNIICLTNAAKDWITMLHPETSDKIEIVPNSINIDMMANGDGKKFREEYDIGDSPMILSVARIHSDKRLDRLIEAFDDVKQRIPDAKLCIVGPGTDTYEYRQLWKLARNCGIQKDVIFTGGIDNKLMPDAYAAADVVAMTSEIEPFGYFALESWSAGKPAIAYRQGGIGDVFGEDSLCCISPYLPDAFSSRLYKILSDKAFAKAMAYTGRIRLEDRFNLEKNTKLLLRIYDGAISKHNHKD